MTTTLPIALTVGEPAGIGPDILIQLAQSPAASELLSSVVVITDAMILTARAEQLGLPLRLSICTDLSTLPTSSQKNNAQRRSTIKKIGSTPGDDHGMVQHRHCEESKARRNNPHTPHPPTLTVYHHPYPHHPSPGQPTSENAAALVESLRIACDGCLNGQFRAMVTGPVDKQIIHQGGIPFRGHTEWLQQRTQQQGALKHDVLQPQDRQHDTQQHDVLMLLTNERLSPPLRVALVTTHLPLRQVSAALSTERIIQKALLLHQGLQRYFMPSAPSSGASSNTITQPRIAITGLNPHCGDHGLLGHEDHEIIQPAIDALRQQGLAVEGPVSADAVFTPHHRKRADAILAMYHDQGLAPIKALGFEDTVNITLGLPILRTSVDHGTAYALAGTGQASPASLQAALALAIQLSALEETH